MSKELIAVVEIPKYIRKVQVSGNRRATYYKQGEKLPIKYESRLGLDYQWIRFKGGKILLCNAECEPVVKNPNSVGTPKYKIINGQDLHTLRMLPYERKAIIDQLKIQFLPFILQLQPITSFPIKIRLDFYNNEVGYDLDNHQIFYSKAFFDSLVDNKIIPDDDIKYIDSFSCNYIFSKECKLTIKIFGILTKNQ